MRSLSVSGDYNLQPKFSNSLFFRGDT